MDRNILNIKKKIKSCIIDNKMILQGDTVIAGVSGGADSVCMLLFLTEYCSIAGAELVVAHFNHMIRGIEADEDQLYVEGLAKKYGLKFECEKADVIEYSKNMSLGLEEAARKLRYSFFNKLAKRYNNTKIAVAHNKNDRAETVLFNILRGTGLEGLKGISYVNKNIIRPILNVSRSETEQFCSGYGIKYRIDNTNYENDYSRNKIRNELIPYLDNNFGIGVSDRLIRLSNLTKIDNEYIKSEVDKYFTTVSKINSNSIKLNINQMNSLPRAISLRIIRRAISLLKDINGDYIFPDETGFNNFHTEAIFDLLVNGTTGNTVQLPKGFYCKMDYNFLIIERNINKRIIEHNEILNFNIFSKVLIGECEKIEKDINLCNVKFSIEISNINMYYFDIYSNKKLDAKKDEYIEIFDARVLAQCMQDSVLCIRFRKAGDVIQPFGAPGRKKLKDFFIDSKIPSSERNNILLFAINSEIIWIPGIRRSNYALIDDTTSRAIMIRIKIYRDTTGGEQFD